MIKTDCPLVSIGMPLFNEARFVKASVASILSQDYQNLEIIISDNASTDNTASICLEICQLDSRIIFHRFDENLGSSANFQYVLEKATGKYFMWASGHDLWSANLISESVSLLEMNPTAVVAFGSSCWVDENGDDLSRFSGWTDTRGMGTIERFFTVLWGNMHPILGIIRKSALDNALPVPTIIGGDLLLLSKLVIQGDFVHATKSFWQRREFRYEGDHETKLKRYQSAEFAGLNRSLINKLFPLLRLPLKLVECIIRSELNIREKIAVVAAIMISLPARYLAGKR